jgi:single-strand DNA-binding protein
VKSITIAGKLGRDAETRQVGTDTVTSFSVAVDDRSGKKKSTIWFDCSVWGKRGTALAQYLTKGTGVAISGDFGVRSYQAKDGSTKTAFSVRVSELTLMSGNSGGQRQQTGETPAGKDEWNDEDPVF